MFGEIDVGSRRPLAPISPPLLSKKERKKRTSGESIGVIRLAVVGYIPANRLWARE